MRLTQEKVDRVHRWYERTGRWSLTFGYFLPGVRHLSAYVAGVSNLAFPVFALFAYSGGLLWSSSFLALGYLLGERWAKVSEEMRGLLLAASTVVAGVLLLYWVKGPKKEKKKTAAA